MAAVRCSVTVMDGTVIECDGSKKYGGIVDDKVPCVMTVTWMISKNTYVHLTLLISCSS